MFISPYVTLACRSYSHSLPKIKSKIDLSFVEDTITMAKLNDQHLNGVFVIKPSNKDVPLFAHPIIYNNGYGDFVVVDARGYIKEKDDSYIVTQKTDYTFHVLRAALMMHCLTTDSGNDLLHLSDLGLISFSRYIAENLTRRLGLSPEDQAVITLVSAMYYICLFKDVSLLTDKDFDKMVQKISRVTYLGADWIYNKMPEPKFMKNINEFVEVLVESLNSSRTEKLTPALLISFLGGGWFGANGREVMAVALEHPPTILSMVYIALTDRSYRNAGFSKTVLLNDKNGLGKQFIINFERLIANIGK